MKKNLLLLLIAPFVLFTACKNEKSAEEAVEDRVEELEEKAEEMSEDFSDRYETLGEKLDDRIDELEDGLEDASEVRRDAIELRLAEMRQKRLELTTELERMGDNAEENLEKIGNDIEKFFEDLDVDQ